MKKNSYPKYKPCGKTKDGLVIYSLSKLRYAMSMSEDAGSSSVFLDNNASLNHTSEYCLKIFWDAKEAKNSYKRQKLAAKVGLAPPVGPMLIVVDKKLNVRYWGYHTCRAYMPSYILNFKKIQTNLRVRLKKIPAPSTDLPKAYSTEKTCYLGGDLHLDNIGIWNNKHVCIDFGHHSLIQPTGRRLRTNTEHKWNWRKKIYMCS